MADPRWEQHWTLDPSITFLNHGSFGACPRVVLDAQADLRAQIEREPVTFFARTLVRRLDHARDRLSEFLNADPAGLVFVPNATTGVNAVLRSLAFEAGDEIVLVDHAYNAVRNAATFVARRAGARVVTAKLPYPLAPSDGADALTEAVLASVGDKTRLVVLDHITSPTGLILPVERLVDEIQGRGVDVLVDGAHAPGMRALDLRALNAAYYTGNGHKWLCAPKGAGFLYVREDRRDGLHPVVISHGYGLHPGARSRLHVEFDWTGTSDPTPYLCLPVAIETLGALVGDWPALRDEIDGRVREGQALILERLGLVAPAPTSMTGHMAVVLLPAGGETSPLPQDPLHHRLFSEYRIEVPVMPWRDPPRRLVRISAHLYNDRRDYEALADALAAELEGESATDPGSGA